MDLRKLKDEATRALERRNHEKAAELYVQIAEEEPYTPDWRQRAGEAYRLLGRNEDAIKQLVFAAAGYARSGFLLKAIAVCKVVLQMDPDHENVQEKLAHLYAQREGGKPAPAVGLVRRPSGSFEAIAISSLPMNPVGSTPSPLEQAIAGVAEPEIPPGAAPIGGQLATLDEIVPLGSPLDAVPLATVLQGEKSDQFAIADGMQLPESVDADAYAYEIDLTVDEEEPAPVEMAESLLETASATATLPPPSELPTEPLRLERIDDELDLATLFDAEPATPLPKIPLLSSLSPDRLRKVIERCSAHSFEPGHEILHEGERGGSLFVVVSGKVRVVIAGPTDREVAVLGDGEFFGELGLITDFPRSATVVTVDPTEVLEFSRELISEVIASSPEVLRTLLRFFRDRLLDRLVHSSDLFQLFQSEEARALADRFVFLELEPKMRVIHEGQRAAGLFLILAGEVQVAQGANKLATLGPGDVFGEMSLLDGGPAMASIDTLTKCWALELTRGKFQEIVLAYPQVLEYVSKLAERRRKVNQARESRVDYL